MALETESLFCEGILEGGILLGTLKNTESKALESEHHAQWHHCKGNLEGWLLFWGV
jgi:hypothetical protein